MELAGWIEEALRRCHDRGIADPVPEAIRRRLGLVDRGKALATIHSPESMRDKDTARRRLAFDELLRVQLVLVMRRRELERTSRGLSHVVDGEPCAASTRVAVPAHGRPGRVIAEIEGDLAGPTRCTDAAGRRRLGQDRRGRLDAPACRAGQHQGALMAPTEVLAEQHATGVRALLGDLKCPIRATSSATGRCGWSCSPIASQGPYPKVSLRCGPFSYQQLRRCRAEERQATAPGPAKV